MSPRRRTPRGSVAAVALAAAAALALTACGGGQDGKGDKAGKESAAGGGSEKKAAAQGGKDFSEAAKKTAAFGTTAAAGQFPRTVTHAMGSTELKAAPQRVVVLDVGELDNVVSLGIQPVGYAPTEGDEGIPGYLKKDAA